MKKITKTLLVITMLSLSSATSSFALSHKECLGYTNTVYTNFIEQRYIHNVSENTLVDYITTTKWSKSKSQDINIQLRLLKILKVVSEIDWDDNSSDFNKSSMRLGAKQVYNMCREEDF